MTTHVFIIGSKGIPAHYGGFETFVDELTRRKTAQDIRYHVSCLSDREGEFIYNQARCFQVKVPSIGSARAVLYDLMSLGRCVEYIRKHRLTGSIVYILACRIGPMFAFYKRRLEHMGVTVLVNPDGHEWKRGKWSLPVKTYWKISERLMVKHSDLLVCDSRGIEQYILEDYAMYQPKTTFIAYGADVAPSVMSEGDEELVRWMEQFHITPNQYYLMIGRFVPENNYEMIIREFMASGSDKDLVMITGAEQNPFYNELLKKCRFDLDPRIKFVGTVYNAPLLKKIRELAYAYFHGHEVGGTNPSLLEALASTKLNLLYDVIFNREVGGEGALYFSSDPGSLTALIQEVDQYEGANVEEWEARAKNRIKMEYSWEHIVDAYERLFHQYSYSHSPSRAFRPARRTAGTTEVEKAAQTGQSK
ncbi:beta 1-4 rhamnosyltransferase Cps2T [Paenibacillus cineris]|uniref:Rhamnosyltransferase n=1 Tax=Paenibacillus cineris TaxID=237530 RepID=A0ABQ4L8X2_9BACL|nr:DUF1972 domain-containing protein [Paenibacillus cineris]GIO53033.1 rhamnosyltransferase [Paenibacillus cineris]